MISSKQSNEVAGCSNVDRLLEELSSGKISERIAQAARIAVAQHMLIHSQDMQSAVEAENSAK